MARPREFDEAVALDAAIQCFWSRGYEATSVRDLAGVPSVSLTMNEGATVAEVRMELAKSIPELSGLLTRCALAVNHDFVGEAVIVKATDEVAVIPPVSGMRSPVCMTMTTRAASALLLVSLAFAGCAVVISHDRWFLDRIATHILAFEGDSNVYWFEGNFQDYEENRKKRLGGDIVPHRMKYRKLVRG